MTNFGAYQACYGIGLYGAVSQGIKRPGVKLTTKPRTIAEPECEEVYLNSPIPPHFIVLNAAKEQLTFTK